MSSPSKDTDICRPARPSSIDPSRSHSLSKTISPLPGIFNEQTTQKKVAAFQAGDNKSSGSSSTLRSGSSRDAVELWMAKYEYVLRDNQLLKNQIVYLNQHINQLNKNSKGTQTFYSQSLADISKLFMTQIVKCQDHLFQALDGIKQKQEGIEHALRGLRHKLKVNIDKKSTQKGPCDHNEDSLQTRINNLKLKSRIKVLEEELSQVDSKYISSIEWNSQNLPSHVHFQEIFSKEVFDFSRKGKRVLPPVLREEQFTEN